MTDTFLALEPRYCSPDSARYAVLPVPYEGTVSYKHGTASGPAEIIQASHHVELFDEELRAEFVSAGIATYRPVDPAASPEEQMRRVTRSASPILAEGKFLLALGGDHSITAPLVKVCAAKYGYISVLQIDAHADLRDCHQVSKYSHACVMRRVLETTSRICQVGIRSYSKVEYESCPQLAKRFITPAMINTDRKWITHALKLLGDKVYVTIDMDALDPAIAPGVGTPEPGGLTWGQILQLLKRVCTERRVVGADIVEVRPIPPNHVTEFVAAKLAYKIIAYTQS